MTIFIVNNNQLIPKIMTKKDTVFGCGCNKPKPATPPVTSNRPPIPYEKVPGTVPVAPSPVITDPKNPNFDFKKASAAVTAPVKETTGYSDETVLARIVDLARR